jgi:hypothetical protein
MELRPKEGDSPYFGSSPEQWKGITAQLLRDHPLDAETLVTAVLNSWEDIFTSRIGPGLIGESILPSPQIMGFLLHELIPVHIEHASSEWRKDATKTEHDLVYLPDARFSTEVKTSSDPNWIFGNRSYGMERAATAAKAKSGYYCTVNFEKWDKRSRVRPEINLVRFGWIDSTDWRAQTADTGQKSTLPGLVYANQLAVIYSRR